MTDPAAGLGAVYTRPWAARLVLDLIGYTSDDDLAAHTIVEPCCGDGAFVEPIVRRLLKSVERTGRGMVDTASCIRAWDLDPEAVAHTRARVSAILVEHGASSELASELAEGWIAQGDFLLDTTPKDRVRWVAGNPPYVRVEDVPADRAKRYRTAWPTMTGRADVYIGFFEAALSMLEPGGIVGFLCADRWMKNQYGAALRRKVADGYALDVVLELTGVDAFERKVAAYPAITVIRNGERRDTLFARARSSFDEDAANRFVMSTGSSDARRFTDPAFDAHRRLVRPSSKSTWAIASEEDLTLVDDLEARFRPLEDTGVKVRGGAATGADDVYIVGPDSDIEPEVLFPLIGPTDFVDGNLVWSGRHLLNPWGDAGLIPLDEKPIMTAHLRANEKRLRKRYVARQYPSTWWRTIDRPNSAHWSPEKLVVADIKNRIEPVLDTGGHVPMHSLYYLTSTAWDLEVLGGLLMSDVVGRFLAAHSVLMSSGAIRVSAQYLRLIRLPEPEGLDETVREKLRTAFRNRDRGLASAAAQEAFGLSAPNAPDVNQAGS